MPRHYRSSKSTKKGLCHIMHTAISGKLDAFIRELEQLELLQMEAEIASLSMLLDIICDFIV